MYLLGMRILKTYLMYSFIMELHAFFHRPQLQDISGTIFNELIVRLCYSHMKLSHSLLFQTYVSQSNYGC